MEITSREMSIMRHSLGLDSQDEPYRNNFVAGIDHSDIPQLESMVSKGLMIKRKYILDEVNDSYVFHVTCKGKREVMKHITENADRSQER